MSKLQLFKSLLVGSILTALILPSYLHARDSSSVSRHAIQIRSELNSIYRQTQTLPYIISSKQHHGSLPAPMRDEGLGEVLWSHTDSAAIADIVRISADGEWIAVGYTLNQDRFELITSESGSVVIEYPVTGDLGGVAISGDGDRAVFSASASDSLTSDSLWIFEWMQGSDPVFRVSLDGYYAGPVDISYNGEYVVVTGTDPDNVVNRAWCFRPPDVRPLWVYEVDAADDFGWYGVNICRDGNLVVINGKYRLHVLDMLSGEVVWETPTHNTESEIAISADGSVIALASLTGWLLVYAVSDDGDGYEELWRYRFTGATSTWVNTVDISNNGKWIAAGTLDFYVDHYGGRVGVFDTDNAGEPEWIGESLADEISDISISADGSVIAATCWDDTSHTTANLVVHERHDRTPFFSMSTQGSLSSVDMSEDGSYIAVGGKLEHNRVFGKGGHVHSIKTEYPGGLVRGSVLDTNRQPIEGVTLSANSNPYLTLTDDEGRYELKIEVESWDAVDVLALKPGFKNGMAPGVLVGRGEVTEEIDFILEAVGAPPQNLTAGSTSQNDILLSWSAYGGAIMRQEINGIPLYSVFGETTGEFTFLNDLNREEDQRLSSDITGINIYRSRRSGEPYILLATVGPASVQYRDMYQIIPLQNFYYVLTADFSDGESIYSNEAVGRVHSEYIDWEFDLPELLVPPVIDGSVNDAEWSDAKRMDISDVYGYDDRDSVGTVIASLGYNDETDQLFFGFEYNNLESLTDRLGVGIYVDDDGDGDWTVERRGSEGNYWGYWIDGEPVMRFRSLTGAPNNVSPYYNFEDPALAFSDNRGHVEVEMAIPLGFHSLQEVAIYTPEYTIGLGLFAMHRTVDSLTVFDGWWPQNMLSIVTTPELFARVRIPVTLTAPPAAPDSMKVIRDEARLLLTWIDPVVGLDNSAVRNLAGIEIIRNGDYLATVDPGVEMYLDDTVENGGWYEYTIAGLVVETGDSLKGPETAIRGEYAGAEPVVRELRYDDGSAEAFYVVTFDGADNRFAVRFDIEDDADSLGVFWVEYYASSLHPIGVYIAEDENDAPGVILGEAFTSHTSVGSDNYRFHFPDVRVPRLQLEDNSSKSIWVVLDYLDEYPANPAIGVDRSAVDSSRYMFHTLESGWSGFNGGRLMVGIGVGELSIVPDDEDRPQWTSVPETVQGDENSLIEFQVVGGDPNGDELTIFVTSQDLPSGWEFIDNADGTGEFNWTPTYDDSGVYSLWLNLTDGDLADETTIEITVSQVDRPPEEFSLGQNFPNPFNVGSRIPVFLPERTVLEITIHDTNGRILRRESPGFYDAGRWDIPLNTAGLPSGTYIVKVRGGSDEETVRISLIR